MPKSSDRPRLAQAHILRTADGGMIAIHLSSLEKFWTGLVAALEAPELARDPRFATRLLRIENYEALGAELDAAASRSGRSHEWVERLAANDVPFAPINSVDAVVERSAGAAPRASWCRSRRRTTATQAVRPAVQFDGQRADRVRPAPLLGEHGATIRAALAATGDWPHGPRHGAMTLRRNAMLLPTTLVGSYPQPEWLIDRAKLAGRFPPRVRARELWRIPEPLLAEAQDDATLLAIRAQEAAGLDIITDGEIRRESYSNRFATALEGVDLDNPGTALDRSGHPNPVPRVVGPIRRRHPVEVDDLRVPARRTPTGRSRSRCPGRSRCRSRRRTTTTAAAASWRRMDYAAAVNEEIRDLFAAGADIVQIDEPYMQARPEEARAYGLEALNRALDGVTGTTAVHICFGYAAIIHERPDGLLVPARARAAAAASRSRSRPRSRTSTAPCSRACRARRSSSA